MSRVSVLIPSRSERFLHKTVVDVLAKARGDIEVIVAFDGDTVELPRDARIKTVHHPQALGMRACINDAASIATGDYLMKCDAHVMFAEGYDEVLKADCGSNWIVIPRRYSLDAENWAIEPNRKPPRDYHYLCYPDPHKEHDGGMHGVEWPERGRARNAPEFDIDDTMSAQGSCWFMSRGHWDRLGGMSEVGYGGFSQEFQEIGLKTWLGGGECKVNKRTWMAHLHKGKRYGRMYSISQREIIAAHNWSARHWMRNEEPRMVRKLEWLVDKFAPVPTWNTDWRTQAQADYGVHEIAH